jgi:glutamine amidotransferase
VIALVDYGIGNLRSVEKALQAVGAQVTLTSDPQAILRAVKVVLPGVGAFGDGMAGLRERGLVGAIRS